METFTMVLEVNELKFRYPKSAEDTIRDISFSIAEGEIFGFLGPSGAGKSTTQKILTKQLTEYSGKVTVFGRDLKSWNNDYYNKIGVGFELPNHYEKLTALENLQFFSTFYSNCNIDFKRLLEKVDLTQDINTQVAKFSKGMKMRLNFARSIMHNPDLLFLDEPTSGLDPVNARRIKNMILAQKAAKKTVFLTTHNMHDAKELCDTVAFMVKGQIKVIDSPKNLILRENGRFLDVEYLKGSILISKEFELDGLGENAEFLNILKNYQIKTMHTKETGLEDIFIKMTGESI
jgi:fluoroquinolone transport system ATP-binding protein